MTTPGTRVLVVDDDDDNRTMYAEYLEHAGFSVETAANGEEALSSVRARRPDVIVLDLSLPGIDGWEVTRVLKGDTRTTRIRIIAVTGRAEAHHVSKARDVGCDDVLVKPLEPRALADAIMASCSTR